MADSREKRGYKRKRKKSFLVKQKQYGKKGRFGQGVELSEDSYQYFIRILEVIKHSRNSAEDMEILAGNVIAEMHGKEVDTCSNQLASRVVEELTIYAPDDKLIELSNKFSSELRLVFSDPYCSHVLQTVIISLAKRILCLENIERSREVSDQLMACFQRIAMFAFNNVEDFFFDTYANHVLRTIFACINGHAVKIEIVKEELLKREEENRTLPEEFENLSVMFVTKVAAWPQFNDLAVQVLTSGCLQALMISVKSLPKLSKKLVKKVMEMCENFPELNLVDEKHQPVLHLIESSIVAAAPKLYHKIYKLLFKQKLKSYALNKTCNFVVQKLLLYCPVKETFDEMFADIADSFSDILKSNHTGVILALAKTCRRLKTKQGEFLKLLLSALNCEDPTERHLLATPLVCCLSPFELYNAQSTKISLHGSLILQELLYYTKPIRLVTSLLAMPDKSLVALLCDPRGCHVTDAFIESPFVGAKSREKLFKTLQGHYVTLAISRHGSRSLEAVWSILNCKQKALVMEELKAQQGTVVAALSGRVVASKMRLDLFRQNKESWLKQFSDLAGGFNNNRIKREKIK